MRDREEEGREGKENRQEGKGEERELEKRRDLKGNILRKKTTEKEKEKRGKE